MSETGTRQRVWARLGLLPPPGLVRALYVRTLLFSVGAGTFLSMSPIFFSRYAGLSPAAIGAGLTMGLTVGIVLGPAMGRLSDRFSPRNVWSLACVLECVMYLSYPLVGSFLAYAGVVALLSTVEALGSSARTTYILSRVPDPLRVEAYAYMRSALNIGFTVGAGVSALALLAEDRQALLAGPLVAAVMLLANGVLVHRLPGAAAARSGGQAVSRWGALGDFRFLQLAAGVGALEALEVLLNVTIPLWIIQRTDANLVWVPVLFAVNTVLVVVLQVPTSRRFDTLPAARVAARVAVVGSAATCVAVGWASSTSGMWTVALLVVGYVALTATEVVVASASWTLFIAASPEAARGEYQAVWRSSFQSMRAVCPALFAALIFTGTQFGWLLVAVFFGAAGAFVAHRVAEMSRTAEVGQPSSP